MKLLYPIVTGVIVVAAASSAFAATCAGNGDTYVYAGSDCKLRQFQNTDTYFSFSSGNSTGIKNSDTAVRNLSCPLIRPDADPQRSCTVYSDGHQDCEWADGGMSSAKVLVTGTSWSASDVDVYATSWDGTTYYHAPTPTLTESNGTSEFTFSPYSVPAWAVYTIAVAAMPGEWVKSYRFTECADVD